MLNFSTEILFSSPVGVVLMTALIVMMFDLFKPKSNAIGFITIVGLLLAISIAYFFYPDAPAMIWTNLFIADKTTYFMQIVILLAVGLSVYFSSTRLRYLNSETGDIISLYLLATVGMMCLVAAQSFLSIYISLELTSLPLYALVASQRNSVHAVEAAVKYFVMGAIASVFILFGISMLYGLTGHLELNEMTKILQLKADTQSLLILFSLIMIISGASFKLALVPFHMWIPDVYAGANPVMTLYLSAAPKIAGFAIFLRLALAGLFDILPITPHILALLALLSIIFGNLCALVQKDLRRLLAYSTISHMGYAMLGLVAGGPTGQSAALFYIVVYSLMTLAGFSAILLAKDERTFLLELKDLQGLSQTTPWLAAMLLIVFFSMAGIPPAVGFFAKFFVIRALIDASMYFYAILALLFAVIGTFYYLKLIKTMYFESPFDAHQPIIVANKYRFVYILQVFTLLGLGLIPNWLVNICLQAI